jgi:hypothetical protein
MEKYFKNLVEDLECLLDDYVVYPYKRIRDKYYDVKYGIKNLIRWFPVIWGDRDWDFAYMFALLEKKFEHYEKEWSSDACFVVGSEKQVKRFKICKELCRRLKDDWYYHENTFMFHDKKWGDLEFTDSPRCITRTNIKSKEDDDLEATESLRLFKIENARKDADVELLQMYIRKYWKTWWW